MTLSDEINFGYLQWITSYYILIKQKCYNWPRCYQCIFWDIVLQWSPGSVATDPGIWGMLQHFAPCFKTFTALKLHVCWTSKPDENQADR